MGKTGSNCPLKQLKCLKNYLFCFAIFSVLYLHVIVVVLELHFGGDNMFTQTSPWEDFPYTPFIVKNVKKLIVLYRQKNV